MKYMKLDQKGSAMAEYIWIDATGGVRSKSKVCKVIIISRIAGSRCTPDICVVAKSHFFPLHRIGHSRSDNPLTIHQKIRQLKIEP
jgi:hypothetical protein